ncbi:MAG: sigma-70 family RNA polymerase sigma factor [Isosphaeraceae bacterium]
MFPGESETEDLLRRAAMGDEAARGFLLDLHRARLRQMVAVRMDRRLAARQDPSDIVQEALADASEKLETYLKDRPIPFYPWLRRLAEERLIHSYRRNVKAAIRTVDLERPLYHVLPDGSVWSIAQHLAASATGPLTALERKQTIRKVQDALNRLKDEDREVIVLRYVEELPFAEVAAALGIGLQAAKMRHLRALQRLRPLLDDPHAR